jgi:hypothetical protein
LPSTTDSLGRKFRLLILEFLNVYDEKKNTTRDVAQNPFWSAMPRLMDFVEYTEITVQQVLNKQLPDASCLKMLSEVCRYFNMTHYLVAIALLKIC